MSLAQNEPSTQRAKVISSLAQDELSSNRAKLIFTQEKGFKTLNHIEDELMPQLEAAEQIVLRRLYRLSFGFNRNVTDSVSLNKLAIKCNMGDATVKRALNSLKNRGLIVVHSDKSRDPNGGNRYTVLPQLITSLAQIEPSSEQAKPRMSYINDHDDLNNTDHHQSETMRIYQTLTGNTWTRSDQSAYEKIRKISLDTIEQGIRVATARAASRPGSLAYFVKEISNLANPATVSLAQRRKELQKIIDRVRVAHTGQAGYTMADFSADVKELCGREGVVFDYVIFNEIVG